MTFKEDKQKMDGDIGGDGACVVYDNDIPYPEGSYRVRRTCKGWKACVL